MSESSQMPRASHTKVRSEGFAVSVLACVDKDLSRADAGKITKLGEGYRGAGATKIAEPRINRGGSRINSAAGAIGERVRALLASRGSPFFLSGVGGGAAMSR